MKIFDKFLKNYLNFIFGVINMEQATYQYVVYSQMKDEDSLIFFWIEHYKMLGFEHLYIYDDSSTNQIKNKVLDYGNFVTVLDNDFEASDLNSCNDVFKNSKYYDEKIFANSKKLKQHYILNWFQHNYKHEFTWCLVVDADEFLYLRHKNTIHEYMENYLSKYDNIGEIVFFWCIFGTSYHSHYPTEGHLFENFTLSENVLCRYGKSLTNFTFVKNTLCLHLMTIYKNICYTPSPINPDELINYFDLPESCFKSPGYVYQTTTIELNQVDAYIAHFMTQDSYNFMRKRYYRNNANGSNKSDVVIPWLCAFNNIVNTDLLKYVKNRNTIINLKEPNLIIDIADFNRRYKTNFDSLLHLLIYFYKKKNCTFSFMEFNVNEYKILNPELGDLNDVQLRVHYLTEGFQQNLKYTFLSNNTISG